MWVSHIGGVAADVLYTLAWAGNGSVVTGGEFAGALQIDGRTLLNSRASSRDGFIISLREEDGAPAWARSFGGDREDSVRSVAPARDGGIYATGYFTDRAWLDGANETHTLNARDQADMFVLRLDQSGRGVWKRGFGGRYGDIGAGLAAAGDGVLAAGQFQLEAGPYGGQDKDYTLTSRGSMDVSLLNFDAAGRLRWSRGLGGQGMDTVADLASGADGALAVTGAFERQADMAGIPLTADGPNDIFLLRMNETGKPAWARRLGGPKADHAGRIAMAGDGAIVYAGRLQGAWPIGDCQLESAGATDIAVLSWSEAGDLRWCRSFGGGRAETVEAVAVDAGGRIHIAGSFIRATTIAGRNLESTDGDAFLLVLDAGGEVAGLYHFPSRGIERIMALAVPAPGEVIIGGVFQTEMRIGEHKLHTRGKSDVFVARLRLP